VSTTSVLLLLVLLLLLLVLVLLLEVEASSSEADDDDEDELELATLEREFLEEVEVVLVVADAAAVLGAAVVLGRSAGSGGAMRANDASGDDGESVLSATGNEDLLDERVLRCLRDCEWRDDVTEGDADADVGVDDDADDVRRLPFEDTDGRKEEKKETKERERKEGRKAKTEEKTKRKRERKKNRCVRGLCV
jgi:hypothetical protein